MERTGHHRYGHPDSEKVYPVLSGRRDRRRFQGIRLAGMGRRAIHRAKERDFHDTHDSFRFRVGRHLRCRDCHGANRRPWDRQLTRSPAAGIDTTCSTRSSRATTDARNAAAAMHAWRWRSAMLAESRWRIRDHWPERPPTSVAADGSGRRHVLSATASAVSAWGHVDVGCAVPAERGSAPALGGIAAARPGWRHQITITTTAADLLALPCARITPRNQND